MILMLMVLIRVYLHVHHLLQWKRDHTGCIYCVVQFNYRRLCCYCSLRHTQWIIVTIALFLLFVLLLEYICICTTISAGTLLKIYRRFSNVTSNDMHKKMHRHIGCICLTFLHGVFSNLSSCDSPFACVASSPCTAYICTNSVISCRIISSIFNV